jgi:hypothetical protein
MSFVAWQSPFAADCYSQIGCVSGEQVKPGEPTDRKLFAALVRRIDAIDLSYRD